MMGSSYDDYLDREMERQFGYEDYTFWLSNVACDRCGHEHDEVEVEGWYKDYMRGGDWVCEVCEHVSEFDEGFDPEMIGDY